MAEGVNYTKMEGSRKNSIVYVCDNYIYAKDKLYKNSLQLRCVQRTIGCRGYAVMIDDVVTMTHEHNHHSSAEAIETRKLKSELKRAKHQRMEARPTCSNDYLDIDKQLCNYLTLHKRMCHYNLVGKCYIVEQLV